MGTKRVELQQLDVFKVTQALRIAAEQYRSAADVRGAYGWADAEEMWRKSADEIYAIIAKLEDCDTVAIETDEMDDGTCPECGTVHSGLLDCRNTPLDRR